MNSTTHDIFGPYQRVDNYNIVFDEKPGTGIFEYDGKVFKLLSGENMQNMTLEDIIDFLNKKYEYGQIKLYAVFCRGSDKEKIGYGSVSDFSYGFDSVSGSDFDFSALTDYDSEMSLDGGVKKNRSKTKRKMIKPKKKKMRKTKQKKPIKPKKKKMRKTKQKKTHKTKKKKTRK